MTSSDETALCAAVVVYCHSRFPIMGRFLLRAEHHGMTDGNFALFTFWPQRSSIVDVPWNFHFDKDVKDQPLHTLKRPFHAVKQVRASNRL